MAQERLACGFSQGPAPEAGQACTLSSTPAGVEDAGGSSPDVPMDASGNAPTGGSKRGQRKQRLTDQ